MNRERCNRSGFTLVEILIVIFLLAIFIGAAYSLYVAHMKTAVSQEEIVDVQQNLRLAMDAISKDVAMGGFLSPVPLNTGAGFANHSSVISLAMASAEKSHVRISDIDAASPPNYTVAPHTGLNRFKIKDTVRSINPEGASQGVFTVDAVTVDEKLKTAKVRLNLLSGVAPQVGDVLCKITTTAAPFPDFETVTYSLSTDAAQCGAGLKCIVRSVNQRNPEVIALIGTSKPDDEGHLRFDYLLKDGRGVGAIGTSDEAILLRAVRITLTGQAAISGEAGKPGAIRRMNSLVRLRNPRGGT